MSRSLGLAAYRALTRRGPTPKSETYPARPDGDLVWLHAAEPGSTARAMNLARRLVAARFGLNVLLSLPEDAPLPAPCPSIQCVHVPSEHPTLAETFMSHWAPDVGVWMWGDLRPNLLIAASESGTRLILVDAGQDGFDSRRDRWLPEVPRRLLRCFDTVIARSDQATARLMQLGCPPERLEEAQPLVPGGQTLPVQQSDLDDMSAAFSGRPVWFAAGVTAAEFPAVLAAHQRAQRMSHRLLLVVNPADADADAKGTDLCSATSQRITRWSDGTMPDEHTSILFADTPDENGLWFRVAPVAFLGGSLAPGSGGQDPFPAAALGSAILYGPGVGQHLDAYTRLANAGAARIVNDADSLGTAVTWLIAPDQAAKMAMAGWDVVTEGAAVMDRIVELVQTTLDSIEDGTT